MEQDRHVEQWNKIEDLIMSARNYSHLIFDKDGGKTATSTGILKCQENCHIYYLIDNSTLGP